MHACIAELTGKMVRVNWQKNDNHLYDNPKDPFAGMPDDPPPDCDSD